MRARDAARRTAWLGVALLALASCERPPEPARPPLVVLISVDTLRRDALRAFDPSAAALPHLDVFAAESARFEEAASVASWTLPAHASMLTGLEPERHGATDPTVALAQEVATLAERFRANGYETVGITDGGYLDRRYGFDRGFDSYADVASPHETIDDAQRSILDLAAARLAERTDARPLFLFLQTYAVHDYFRLQPWAIEQLSEKPTRGAPEYAACLQGMRRCDDAEWATLRALYDAEIRSFDAAFGRFRAAAERAGLWDGAVVVLTSDHGEGFEPARGRIHHGGRLHEDLIRIPLLVRAPGVAPRALADPISLVDVTPTLLELAAIAPIAGADGRSFAASLRGGAAPAARPLFAVEHYSSWWMGSRTKSVQLQARPLSIAVVDGDRWYLRGTRGEELYDMASDPRQANDLAKQREGELPALRVLAAERDVDRAASPHVESTTELRDRLRALGYAE